MFSACVTKMTLQRSTFHPPGCLPLPRGNVRTEQQVSIYEHFQHIQRPPKLCCPAKLLHSAHLNIFLNPGQSQRYTFLTRAGLRKSQCSPYVSQIILYSRTHFPSSNRQPTPKVCSQQRQSPAHFPTNDEILYAEIHKANDNQVYRSLYNM